jgi:formamidopyrimidine-DNA glycosylase
MPELPDVVVYVEALRARVLGQPLERVRILSPFLVRSVDPTPDQAEGLVVADVRRMGKRIVFRLAIDSRATSTARSTTKSNDESAATANPDDLFLVFHLMIAGRFRWLTGGAKPPGKITLACFDFPDGTLALTEAGSRKRASLHMVRGQAELAEHDPGGLEVLEAALASFAAVLRRENHTLKRALTDPRLFSGIGNAYSDEILHAARLSPTALTRRLSDEQVARLFEAARGTLEHWTTKLQRDFGHRFPGPGEITAFRPDFAVHGRFGQQCPACDCPVQRIRYAENETNYCPGCQTGGRILADRSLSRLLKKDWPRTVDELESR